MGIWNVLNYQEVFDIVNDPNSFSNRTAQIAAVTIDASYTAGDFAQMDPPQQTRYRKLVSRAFAARTLAALEPRAAQVTSELLGPMADKERIELVEELAYPLPLVIICQMLGIPVEDQELFKKKAFLIMEQLNGMAFLSQNEDAQANIDAAVDQFQPMIDYMHAQIAQRRRKPRDDMMSELVQAEVEGQRLTDAEIANIANFILIAGHITTTMLIGNAVVCLDSNPDAFARVRADRSLVPSALEETMRTLTPSAAVSRRTTTEVEIGGCTIPADRLILAWAGAANRDPSRFDDPDVFDPARDPNPHLGFGYGVHYCLGAGLARLVSRVALNGLLDHFPVLRIDPGDPPRFFPTPDVIGTACLPLQTCE